MVLRMILAFIMHRGRMSCSQAAGSIATKSVHRGQLTRFLAGPRWQKHDFSAPLRMAWLQMETGKGKFVFVIDATLVSQAGDTAYDAAVVGEACEDRDYTWIVPANPERVYEGSQGKRPKLRSRLKD